MKIALVFPVMFVAAGLHAGPDQTNSTPPPKIEPKLQLIRTNQYANAQSTNQVEQLRNLTPEERRAKIEELRAQHAAKGTNSAAMPSQQERVARFRALTEQMRRKNQEGALSPAQQHQLANMEAALKRLEEQNNRTPIIAPTNSP